MSEALTTKRPSLSRISRMAPSSLPVIFSRMVVFPAFRRPMINTRYRLRYSNELSMLVRSTEQRSRSDGTEVLTQEATCCVGSTSSRMCNAVRSLNAVKPYRLDHLSFMTYMKTRKLMQGLNGVPSKPYICCAVALALPGLLSLLGVNLWQWSLRRTSGVSPMQCTVLPDLGSRLCPPAPFQFRQEGNNQERNVLTALSPSATEANHTYGTVHAYCQIRSPRVEPAVQIAWLSHRWPSRYKTNKKLIQNPVLILSKEIIVTSGRSASCAGKNQLMLELKSMEVVIHFVAKQQ